MVSLFGTYFKNPIILVTIIFFFCELISLSVSNLFTFNSGDTAKATDVKYSSIGKRKTSLLYAFNSLKILVASYSEFVRTSESPVPSKCFFKINCVFNSSAKPEIF